MIEDIISVVRGLFSLLKPSTWRWMGDAIEEHSHMGYTDMIGVVVFGDIRAKRHYERTQDW